MNHDEIRDGQLIELYLLGRLDRSRTELLEEHLLACEQCNEEIELQRAFISGMRRLDPQELGLQPVRTPLAEAARWRRLALAASLLLAITGPLSVWNLYRTGGESGGADIAAVGPLVVMPLVQTRGYAAEPANVLELHGDEGWLVLQPDGEYRAHAVYEVRVQRGGDAVRQDRARADARGALVVALPPRALAPGDYTIAIAEPGSADALQQFALRVADAIEGAP